MTTVATTEPARDAGRSARGPATVRRIVDAEQWNRFVQGFAAYDFKQGFEWGEVRHEQGWSPTRFAAFQDGDCVAACSVLTRSVPGLGAILYAPRGPLFHATEPTALARLLEEVGRFGRSIGGILLRLSPGIRMDDSPGNQALGALDLAELPEPWTTWNTPRYVQVLHLGPDEKTLLAGVRRRMREYIAAAPRKGLTIEPSERDDDLVAFHALMVNVGRMKGFPVRDLAYYRTVVRQYREIGAASLLVARAGDTLVGGLLAVHFGRRAYLLYTSVRGNAPDQIKHHVAPALTWEFVRRARATGCEVADFGGSGVQLPPSETDAGWGVYHFKAGLGCTLETFVPFRDLVLRPRLYRSLRLVEARVLPQAWRLMARMPGLVPRFAGVGA
jgi:lipid II:glycine glycyltransferase (peptidoglycan interpeptide bridge formation enzyme)